MPNGFVQVTDLEEPDAAKAKIDVALDARGQFTIPHLTPGHTYQLIARVKDGGRLLAASRQTSPPNPRLALVVSEEQVTPETPPLPGPTALPGRGTDNKEKEPQSKGPAAEIGLPIRARTEAPADPGRPPASETGTAPPPPVPERRPPTDLENVAERDGNGGFPRVRSAPTITIPGAPARPPVPPTPPSRREDEDRVPFGVAPAPMEPQPAPPPPKPVEASPRTERDGPTPVPSCVLVGRKLENFALFGLDGRPWEFTKDRKGRMVLLHFWSSTGGLEQLATMRELQARYERQGLQVIGIAYESGSIAQQTQAMLYARGRYVLNYVTLLGGGGEGPCPVRSQFLVDRLPECVLLAADGTIVYRLPSRSDPEQVAELGRVIEQALRASQP
jgi:hypothetical protein